MEFLDLVNQRESIRNYDPEKPVANHILKNILEAGRLAPSAANLQPWQFIVIISDEKLAAVRESYPRSWFMDAPCVLAVTGDQNSAWHRADGYSSIETDLTIAMDHIILAAESVGVGTCWVGNFDYKKLRTALELKPNEVVFAITPLGYPRNGFRKSGVKNRKSFDEVVKYM
jgi:nitroreductase